MFQIDVPTAMIVLIIGQFFTGVIGLAYRIRTEEDSFIQSFLLSRLFEMIAWIMMALRGLDLVPEYLSSLVANSLLIVSASLQVGALLKIKGKYQDRIKRIYRLINIVAPIIMLLLILLRTTEEVRVFVLSVALIGTWIYPIYIMLVEKKALQLQKAIAFIYGVGLVPYIYRLVVILFFDGYPELVENGLGMTITFLCVFIVVIMGNMGFLLLAKEKAEADIERLATIDDLTDAYNRYAFISQGQSLLRLAIRKQQSIAILLLDLDSFKAINDTFGHFTGDIVLQSFAQQVKKELPDPALFGRIGGEEFMVAIPDINKEEVLALAERVRQAAEQDVVLDGKINYTISIGVLCFVPMEGLTTTMMYHQSDLAMYQAKIKGKNRVEYRDFVLEPEV